MKRRPPEAVQAPPAMSQRLLRPVIEEWVAPSEVTSGKQAQALATERWRAEVDRWTATPGAYLAIGIEWNRAYLVGNLMPTFADRDAFEWAVVLST